MASALTRENSAKATHEELQEQLKNYMTKYRNCGLLAANAFAKDDKFTVEQVRQAETNFKRARAVLVGESITALESLTDVFEEAFQCLDASVDNPGRMLVCKRSVEDFLQDE